MKSTRILPPTYLLIAIICMIVLRLVLPLMVLIPVPWNMLGGIPLILGAAMNITADRTFHKAGTTIRPFEVSAKLVTEGLFRFTRNPMYLGFVFILIGVAVMLGSLTPFITAGLFAVLMDSLFIPVEEQMLSRRFGADWRDYAARTRRWI